MDGSGRQHRTRREDDTRRYETVDGEARRMNIRGYQRKDMAVNTDQGCNYMHNRRLGASGWNGVLDMVRHIIVEVVYSKGRISCGCTSHN